MKEKPLTPQEFEQCKLIANTKHMDDSFMMAIASWSYEQYLLSRWHMQHLNCGTSVCAVDPSHTVLEYANRSKVSLNLRTGEEKVIEMDGDGEQECQECLGRKTQVVVNEMTLDDFENLQ